MKAQAAARVSVLMIAYTNYATDGRVIREAEAAASAGFDVDVLALRKNQDSPEEVVRGVRVIRLNQSRYRGSGRGRYVLSYLEFFLRCFWKCTILFFKKRYRVIHVNNMPDFLVFCTIIPKLFGAKVLLDIHDPMPNTFASKFRSGEGGLAFRLLLWQERWSARYAHRVITVHEPVKEFVLVKHGLPPESIQVIANFADEQLFRVREHFSLDGKLTAVFHGTILERYGFKNLMLALSQVRNRGKLTVRIIGEGDFSAHLTEMIASLGLKDMVHFERGPQPFHRIPDLITDCQLGLAPLEISSITNYALPLKLIEYIAMGLPVVTVRNEAIGFYFKKDDCLFYENENPESLRVLLDNLIENPSILMRYRKRALELRSRFLWSNEKAKYIALLRELAGCPSQESGREENGAVPASRSK